MISLSILAERIHGQPVHTSDALTLRSVSASSLHVAAGDLFIAVRGVKSDGHAFVSEAFLKGAAAAVVEDAAVLGGKPGIVVSDTRVALSHAASLFAGEPSQRMKVIGVTGTNGKTTTHWMIANLLEQLGEKVLRIGTVGVSAPTFSQEAILTTPDPVYLHNLFARAVRDGCTHAVMEVSSHALDQHRVDSICFDAGVFTNLTRDHLDYHKTMEAYAEAKAKLFALLGSTGKGVRHAVINTSVAWGQWFYDAAVSARCSATRFGFDAPADLQISGFLQSIAGSSFHLHVANAMHQIKSPFIGRYNGENLAAALGVLFALGYDHEKVIAAASAIPQVPGRLEACGRDGIGVYVDYAHTPDALHNALAALKPITKRKLWVVFGCGGDRDKGKRPQMALVANSLADKIVVTSDNPRTEDPQAIIDDILASGIAPAYTDVSREAAIREAITQARPGDIVLIAGKGHENYQILGTKKIHFSDQEIVHDAFRGTA